ncbi:hypothetical protein Sjap_007002 [Stephania japonica]|uniref:gibberellin 2beta-dioxygenase n=1 Tax=Stephania japonica TaxID=461633 RepID=A0AAP0PLM3_9MAGN
MVVASSIPHLSEKISGAVGFPIIDLSLDRSHVSNLMVKACKDFGFFKVINHGVPKLVIDGMEKEGLNFFSKTDLEKRSVGLLKPLGYGNKSIGLNGDMGDVEYLLLHANSQSISQASKSISKNSAQFYSTVNNYTQAVKKLACEILELIAEGLWVHDKYAFSRYIRDIDSDSLIRINYYPTCIDSAAAAVHQSRGIGFGEHSDPQILTILHSNEVGGFQVALHDGTWVAVPPDSMVFNVIVGDLMQVFTNGRFKSARHRALANTTGSKSRISIIYFGAPPKHAMVYPIPEVVKHMHHSLYRPFTWDEFKQTSYSLRLGDRRLDLFKVT